MDQTILLSSRGVKSFSDYYGDDCNIKIYYRSGTLARVEEYIDSDLSKATNYDGKVLDDYSDWLHSKMLDEQ